MTRFAVSMVLVFVVAAAWLVVGALVGVVEARHGAWHGGWIVSAILGPFAVPLALERRRRERPTPWTLAPSRARRGRVDLLIGVDGSASATTAASLAVRLFGPRVRRVTLATVLDVDTATPRADGALYPEERSARAHLEAATATIQQEAGVQPGSVILAGQPADALEQYAIDEGYEVIVVGCRGKGLSKLLLGSCASTLACKTKVPVLLIPADPAMSATGSVGSSSAIG